jgi:hypothetical protein
MRTMLKLAVAVGLAGLLAACTDKGTGGNGGVPDGGGDANPGGGEVHPGQVTGRALDTQGQPLAGAVIYVGGAGIQTTPRKSTTDAHGQYMVDNFVPRLTYKAFGWVPVTYRGKNFCLRLTPEDPSGYESFVAELGAVRNFRWKLQGRIEDSVAPVDQDGAYYGGTIRIFPQLADDYTGLIELQLTPTGPLIDGSQGQALTRTVDLLKPLFALDIPVGVYKVTATRIKTDGTRTAARVGPTSSEVASESTLEFNPETFGSCGSAVVGSGVTRSFLTVVSP